MAETEKAYFLLGDEKIYIEPEQRTYIYGEVDMGELGKGFCAVEFEGEVSTRQVDKYGDNWYCSDQAKFHEEFGYIEHSEPLSSMQFRGDEIRFLTAAEFEELWQQGHA